MNIPISVRKIFLKLCYFSLLILWISCTGKTAVKENKSLPTSEESNNNKNSVSTKKKIIFFGDSLTAGYGLENTDEAFPGLIQQTIDSLHLQYTVVNSGVSGETTAGGRSRIDWVLRQKPHIFILELGANDGLRGIPLKSTKENLQAMIDLVLKKYPSVKIVLAGMQIPPNMGQEYTQEFKNLFPDLAAKNKLSLIPFLLENVGGIPSLNQADGIHPTTHGHRIIAQNVWSILEPLIVK